ncbi:MAG: hypothetical protein AAFS13_04335 [Pseudomonadota bacterium]
MAPTATATAPPSAIEGAAIILSGAESTDVDGTINTFEWRQISGPEVTLFGSDTQSPNFTAPLIAEPSQAVFELTVIDDDGAVATADVALSLELAPPSETVEIETSFDGVPRAYSVYTPASYQSGAPAVLLLHGGGSSMREVLIPVRTTAGWIDFAEAAGFLLIIPNGFNETLQDGLGDQQSWNDLRTDLSGRTSTQDDLGFLLETLDEIAAARGFDPSQVFATGSSNGGIMTFTLMIEAADRVFGAAAFIAALPQEIVQDPLSATPVMILNGREDQLVLFDGGPVADDGAPTRSVPETIDYWLGVNAADVSAATSIDLADTDPTDGCRIVETTYPSISDDGTVVLVYDVMGGGHNIPDPDAPDFGPANEALLGPRCRDADGVGLAFVFFQSLQ